MNSSYFMNSSNSWKCWVQNLKIGTEFVNGKTVTSFQVVTEVSLLHGVGGLV